MAATKRRSVSRVRDNEGDAGAPDHADAIQRLKEIAEAGMPEGGVPFDPDDQPVSGNNDNGQPGASHEALRIVEALLFAAPTPLSSEQLAKHLPDGEDIEPLLTMLQAHYSSRGIHLVRVAGKWAFRTAEDLSYLLEKHAVEQRRLSKAALETLAIIAYHQPVTRAEIEAVRGVATSKGTLDVLMEANWVRPRGRRRAPGKPVTYGTTDAFLSHFGLEGLRDLPGLSDLKGAGLLDANLPPDFSIPGPKDVASLMPDELPLEDEDDETQGVLELDDGEGDVDDHEDQGSSDS